jgi:hypothetical protein
MTGQLTISIREYRDCALIPAKNPRDDFVTGHTISSARSPDMLVAKRDPFHPGAHDASLSQVTGATPHTAAASRLARAMSALQIVGTLLAIPVGIGSGYSMYRANFSVEATCQSLRGNIVAMLDRSVDASTRHMLVRRDVETFENTCGTVDPDATAAFKTLLAADQAAAPVTTATVRHAEPPAPTRRAEPRSAVAAKQPPAITTAPAAETEPAKRDAVSDAVWLAAVRSALVSHERDPAPATSAAPAVPPSSAVAPRMLGELRMPAVQPPAPLAAPALPPPASVATIRAPQLDTDHPVPPALIPEIAAVPKEAGATDGHARSRLAELVAQIPLLGPMIEPGRN